MLPPPLPDDSIRRVQTERFFLRNLIQDPRDCSTRLTAILFAARQVLPAAVLPGEGEHTARRDGRNEESIQEAPESRTSDHRAVESEGRRYHDGVGPTRRSVAGERALHGGRVPDGDTGDRGYRLHH